MRLILIATAAASLAGSALAQAPASPGTPIQSQSTAPVANTPALSYAKEAALSDMYEIQSSQLAQNKSTSQEVKSFALTMIQDHTDSTRMVMAALAKAGLAMPPPPTLDARRQQMIDQLRGLSGAAFDRMYVQQQRLAHQEALALHTNYAQTGDSPALKTAAANIAQVVQRHANMLRSMGPATTSP